MSSTTTIPNLERRVRTNDPDTSWEAAASITVDALTDLQAWILAALTVKSMTDGELVDACLHSGRRATPQRVRTARKELVIQGRVEWTGAYLLTQYQRRTQTWRAA
ncbi:hypothetical protein E3T54_02770 [Cryobacterium sp. Sr8]|uniref:hypothetical protein n=1 Tax=Cryobacterium sp. Sr8 TaxID=1259203 RepID=UPI00106B0BBC|nr:hypothetical protein [Cryobacterium sp. Sr8]TFD80682.1 hypothetical protein E3T54_02770 [Cryobacterium sp. Sr8]